MYYTSRMKNVPVEVEESYYLLHSTDSPRFVWLVEPGENRLFNLRGCMCSECTPDWMKSGQYPFQVVGGHFEESLFWRSMPNDFDPATILNEVLVVEAAKKLEIENATQSIAYRMENLERFESSRDDNIVSDKKWRAELVFKLQAELDQAKEELEGVESRYEAEHQRLKADLVESQSRLAELQKNVS